jgi:hypothetical protein
MQRRAVRYKSTNVLEERAASIFKVEGLSKQEAGSKQTGSLISEMTFSKEKRVH